MSKHLDIQELMSELNCEIDHGESLYSDEGLAEVFALIEEIKTALTENLAQIKAEMEVDELE